MAVCTNGHSSEWDDYCRVCGAPIGPMGASMPSATVVEAPKQSCPACREVREAGEPFCEACGHDFSGSTLQPMSSSPAPTLAKSPLGTAVISADRAYFDQYSSEGSLKFPEPAPATFEIALTREIALIGRRSESRNIVPDLDLSGAYDDPAVSHRHAELRHTAAGWVVVDLGSTNGTRLTPSGPLIAPQVAVLTNGSIFLGAWTAIRIGTSPST